MARLKVWTLVLFCLALIYLAVSGSPTLGIAAPKQQPTAPNVIRMTYSLDADQTSSPIELPPGVPVHVMITMTTPGQTFTWIDIVSFAAFGQPLFLNGFDLMNFSSGNLDSAPRVIGNGAGHLITIDGGCAELIGVSQSAIAVHNKALDDNFQVCHQRGGTITLIY